MEALPPKQAQIWALKQTGKTNKEIAAALGCSENVVRKQMTTIYRKLGIKGGRDDLSKRSLTELHRPEQAAVLIDAATDPFARIVDAIKATRLPEPTAEALLRRLRGKFHLVGNELRAIKTTDMIRMLEERIHLGLQFLDAKSAADASWRDLCVGISAMIEKRNLLEGKPTAVYDFNMRRKLEVLMPEFLAEAKRRGIVVEGDFSVVADSANNDPVKG